MDDVRRACAVLDVTPDCSMRELRSRYRRLVRQWHPDRYASDPQGQAEATLRLRAINNAFRSLLEAMEAKGSPPKYRVAESPGRATGRRLTQEEIDRMVESIGTKGPIDDLLDSLPYAGLEALSVPELVAVALGGLVATLIGFSGIVRSHGLRHLLTLAVAASVALVTVVLWKRFRGE